MTSSPSSTTSGCVSGEDTSEDHLLPSSLAAEELQLALNKEATEAELEKAIARCKELVLECDNMSQERKWLVRHLIELRLRLQECREAMLDPQHLVQAWYQCEDCGYSCHHKCMAMVVRECAHVTASEKGEYEWSICPEEGLSAQKYMCIECKAQLPIGNSWAECEARRCDYTGLYYCTACHWGSSAIIPARVIHNWDFDPQPVGQASLQLLKITAHRPLIPLEKLNPKIFAHVHELSLVKRMRAELSQMRKYLLVCRNAEQDRFLWKNVDTPHLIESPDLYSLQDLVDTNNGELPTKLLNLASVFTRHIKETCEVCKGRGHICEICSNDEILYPFDAASHVCKDCNAVLHKNCFNRKKGDCPKCCRLLKRLEKQQIYTYDDDDCE